MGRGLKECGEFFLGHRLFGVSNVEKRFDSYQALHLRLVDLGCRPNLVAFAARAKAQILAGNLKAPCGWRLIRNL